MLLIFSKRWGSRCAALSLDVLWEMTRNVARSKRTTSSASMILAKLSRCRWRADTFEMRDTTIDDHALWCVGVGVDAGERVS
jgi:hypothetical protein